MQLLHMPMAVSTHASRWHVCYQAREDYEGTSPACELLCSTEWLLQAVVHHALVLVATQAFFWVSAAPCLHACALSARFPAATLLARYVHAVATHIIG